MNRVWAVILIVVVAFVGGIIFGNHQFHSCDTSHITRDTIIIHDTTKIYVPTVKYRKQLGVEVARLPQLVWVSEESAPIISPDSADVQVPIEQVVYEEENYRAVVEGYRPRLVELEWRGKQTIITKTITERKKGWGIAVGPTICWGVTSNGLDVCVGVGGTITYHF